MEVRDENLLDSRKLNFIFSQGHLSALATINQKHMAIDFQQLCAGLSVGLWRRRMAPQDGQAQSHDLES